MSLNVHDLLIQSLEEDGMWEAADELERSKEKVSKLPSQSQIFTST